MVAISGINGAVALTLLKNDGADAGTPAGFMASSVFSAAPNIIRGISDAFAAKPKLQADYDGFYKQAMAYVAEDGSHILADNGKHIALVETIFANRGDFPPEEFRLRTDLGDGASIETVIPSATSMAADTFEADQAQRVKDFVASQASVEAERNAKQSHNDLVAQGKIIDTIILDAAETGKSSNAALAILKNDEKQDDAPLASQSAFYQEI